MHGWPRLLIALAVGCSPPPPDDGGAPAPIEEPPGHATAFGVLDFGDAPEGLDGAEVVACAACHPRHADEWRGSAHAAAARDPLFLQEHSGDPFCTDCHAPRARDVAAEPELAAVGVDCATCHLRGGVVNAARVSGDAPHPSVADPDRAAVGLCRTCHQFDFPRNPGVPMQDTVREWEASGQDEGCVGCHAPHQDGHTDHRFLGHRDEALLARALLVEASAARDGWSTDVVLRLRAHDVGHSVPTGDVFRRLEVRAWVEGRPDNAASELLWRRFDIDQGVWTPAEDQRVPPPGQGERRVELRIPDSGHRIVWAIDLWSVEPRLASRFDPGVQLHTRMVTGVIQVP
ncbi:MAG: hypothetical protein H6719_33315 [Sandaracinaceae bacterium]|nr:hypothetical protein [Sandaracinaceae bacterium]